jgi:hypothetical protein
MSGLELGTALVGEAAWSVPAMAGSSSLGLAGGAGFASAATSGLIGAGGSITMGGLATAGNVLSAGSQILGGFAQGGAADYNASAASAAALATEDAAARNAFALERKNRIESEQLSRAQQQAKARRNVAWGKSGVQMAGSPIELEAGAAWQDEFNLTQMQQTGALEVSNTYYSAAIQASKLRTQSALDSYMGGTYRTGGILSAGGTLLTGGAKKYGGSIYGA